MIKCNMEIRAAAKSAGVFLYEIAEKLAWPSRPLSVGFVRSWTSRQSAKRLRLSRKSNGNTKASRERKTNLQG